MLKRNATIAGIMTIALCTSLVNTNVAFATTRTADEGSNFSSDNKSTSPINTEKVDPTTWTADEGTNFDSDKKCTIKNITFIDTAEGNNNTVYVNGNTLGESSEVKLPNSIKVNEKTYNVTSIGKEAFNKCKVLTSITIPDSVTSIEEKAFYGCEELTGIAIPDSVKSIGKFAFFNCIKLASIEIPDGVTSIEEQQFYGSGLKNITIPNSVKSIGKNAFASCGELRSITIPDSVTSIEGSAFSGSGLRSIEIPNNVTSLGGYTFYNCSNLASVKLPDNIKSIEEGTFYSCNGLTSVTIPDKVTSIGEKAFYDCNGLKSLIIPNSVTSIGNDACKGSNINIIKASESTMEKLEIPGFNKVYFYDEDNSKLGAGYVKMWMSVEGLIENPTKTGKDFKQWVNKDDAASKSTFDNVIKETNFKATYEDATVPTATWDHDKKCTINNIKYTDTSAGNNYTVCVSGNSLSEVSEVKLPNAINVDGKEYNVTSVGEKAFYNCNQLTSITIPDGVTSIEGEAFAGCEKLTSIKIPNSVTSIKGRAFDGCNVLTSITIPEGLTSIEGSAFYGCGITSMIIPKNVTSIGRYAFYDCCNLKSITIPSSVTSIEEAAFYRCNGLTSIEIPNSVISIGEKVFYDCNGLKSLTIPNSVTSIGNDACTGSNINIIKASKSTMEKLEIPGFNKVYFYDEDNSKLGAGYVKMWMSVDGLIENPTKNGKTFEGWVNKDDAASKSTFDNVIKETNFKATYSDEVKTNIKDKIKETLDSMSVNNDTTEDYIINKIATSAGITVTISNFNKEKATDDTNGYVEGTVNAEEKDGSEISVCFRKVISKLSSESGNSELEDSIKQTLDNMSVNNNTTKDEIIDTITQVTTGSAVKVTISGFNKEKATEDRNGYIEGTVNAEEKDGSDIVVYFKKIISKLSNNSSNHHKHKSSSSSGSRSTSKETTGNGASVQPTNKEKDLGSMLKTTNDNKVVSTNSWGDKNLRGTVSNVVDKNGDYVGSMITSSESGTAKLPIGYNESKDLKYIYQYDATTKLFIKVSAVVTVDGENIALPVNKDQTYYVTKDPAADNLLLKEGWNTINGSTYRVEGLELKTGWVLENNTWHYMDEISKVRVENNWNLVNNKWYAFNEKGEMKKGWDYNGGNWYFLDTINGDMKTGWKQEGDTWYNLDSNGAMSTGWKKVDGSWYYLNSNGSMASNTEIDGYALGANGALIS